MNNKPWYQSITIWAAAAVGVLQLVPDFIAQVDKVVPALSLSTNPIVIKSLSIIGIIVAIYGRFTAKTVIK